MTLNDTQKALLTLLSQALWGNGGVLVEADWEQVEELAKDQGVLPMLYRGAMKYKDIIPAERIRIWRGAMYAAVLQNDHMNQAQSEILGWLAAKGIRAAILKGASVARYYNPSDIRCLGDIDLLVDQSDLKLTSDVLKAHGYRRNEHDHDFHVSFVRGDVTLELHYKASVVPDGKGGQTAAKIMDQFLDESTMVSMNEISFPTLSEKHQALMLLMHKERHVLEGGIGLRQLCDWAAFLSVQESSSEMVDLVHMFRECGLLTFSEVVTKACVRYAEYSTDRIRGNSAERGYGSKWRSARALFLKKNPLCAKCRETGKLTPATVVDHIVPHRGDPVLFWDRSNWQPLCKDCHDQKTGSGL